MKRSRQAPEAKLWTRRSMLFAVAGTGLAIPACEFGQLFSWNGGKPILFGYGTAPNYDKRIHTIRIKIFKDMTFWSVVPVPNLEDQLTEYLTQQIMQKTPYKIATCDADTEMSGVVLSLLKQPLNYTQLNEIRQVEMVMTCMVKWKDLRTGEYLSAPGSRTVEPPVPAGLLPNQVDPLNSTALPGSLVQQELSAAPISPGNNPAVLSNQSPPPNVGNPNPGQTNAPGPPGGPPVPGFGAAIAGGVLVRSTATYTEEIGQSVATAEQDCCNNMAQQIVSMMEKAW